MSRQNTKKESPESDIKENSTVDNDISDSALVAMLTTIEKKYSKDNYYVPAHLLSSTERNLTPPSSKQINIKSTRTAECKIEWDHLYDEGDWSKYDAEFIYKQAKKNGLYSISATQAIALHSYMSGRRLSWADNINKGHTTVLLFPTLSPHIKLKKGAPVIDIKQYASHVQSKGCVVALASRITNVNSKRMAPLISNLSDGVVVALTKQSHLWRVFTTKVIAQVNLFIYILFIYFIYIFYLYIFYLYILCIYFFLYIY